jgi:hypothetical protein
VFPGVRESFLRIPLEQNAHVSSVAADLCIAVEGTGKSGAYSPRPVTASLWRCHRPVVSKSQRTSSMA